MKKLLIVALLAAAACTQVKADPQAPAFTCPQGYVAVGPYYGEGQMYAGQRYCIPVGEAAYAPGYIQSGAKAPKIIVPAPTGATIAQ